MTAISSASSDSYRSSGGRSDFRHFRLDPSAHRSLETQRIAYGAGLFTLVVADFWILGFQSVLPRWYLTLFTMSPLLFIYTFAKARRADAPALVGYELILSRRVIRRVEFRVKPAEVLKSEVTHIYETPRGLWLVCDGADRSLHVSRAVESFAELREALASWRPIERLTGFRAFRQDRTPATQAPRNVRAGTDLATDPSLVEELDGVRAASRDYGVSLPPVYQNRSLVVLWIVLASSLFSLVWRLFFWSR